MTNRREPREDSLLRWDFPGASWQLGSLPGGRLPRIVGILNVTPDSFSDGGRFPDPVRAADGAAELISDGADIIDIGGESTRPGAFPIAEEEQLRRVLPVIERVARQSTVPISIDTRSAAVARRAIDAGARIVNDVSGLIFDPAMPSVCAAAGVGVICMHSKGTPETMQLNPHYDDVTAEIVASLSGRLEALESAGIPRERIVIDPGIGFGKTAKHNQEILSHIERFRALGRPVLVGHSRKGFLQKLLARPVDEILAGTIGVAIALALKGVDLLRVHDVRATRDALSACWAIL